VRAERLEREFDVEVEWKGLEIHPELPPGGIPRESIIRGDYFRRAEENLQRLAAGEGLTMRSPEIIANSHLAMEAAEYAREKGKLAVFHRRLFEACYQEGLNLGDVETLARLAEETGLDVAELRQALAERRYQDRLAETTREAARSGVTGTPTFIFGDQMVVGAQPYDVLRQAAERAGARPRPSMTGEG